MNQIEIRSAAKPHTILGYVPKLPTDVLGTRRKFILQSKLSMQNSALKQETLILKVGTYLPEHQKQWHEVLVAEGDAIKKLKLIPGFKSA